MNNEIKNYEEEVKTKLKEDQNLFGELTKERILQIATQTLTEKFKLELERKEKKIEELDKRLKKARDNLDSSFKKGWDADILEIHFEIFTIKVRSTISKDQCGYCKEFEKQSIIEFLKDFADVLNIVPEKLKITLWECDQADRYKTNRDGDGYTFRMTEEGLNFYYATGVGIRRYPAIDLKIFYRQGSTSKAGKKKPEFYRIQGIGIEETLMDENGLPILDKDGDEQRIIQFEDFKNALIEYFKKKEYEKMGKETSLDGIKTHNKDNPLNDMSYNKKFGK